MVHKDCQSSAAEFNHRILIIPLAAPGLFASAMVEIAF
jgi:hypothetical protein